MIENVNRHDLTDRSFAVVSDRAYLPGLWAMLNSVFAYHGRRERVFVLLHGEFSAEVRQKIAEHPLAEALKIRSTDDFRSAPGSSWEAKQQVFAELIGDTRIVCLLDADLVLLSRLDDVFAEAERGNIVSSRDGDDRTFGEEYAVYSSKIVGTSQPYFSSGFLCLDVVRHWDLVGLWAFSARFASHSSTGGAPLRLPGYGDQGVLNGVAAMLGKAADLAVRERHEWCNPQSWDEDRDYVRVVARTGLKLSVENVDTGRPQRLLHNIGPKWWTEAGRIRFAEWTNFLACFDHFARRPAPFRVPNDHGNRSLRGGEEASWIETERL